MLKIANHSLAYKALARELVEAIQGDHCDPELLLRIEDTALTFCSQIAEQQTCYTHSFIDQRLQQRAAQKNQALIKACNNKKREFHRVLDLTAGWGRDSFILAWHGQQVTLVEQNPLLFHCLDYLLKGARKHADNEVLQRLRLVHANALDFIGEACAREYDCLYLDPMFPAHKSSAKPAKELQILQLLTENLSIETVFERALELAVRRVVVKRPLHAAPLNGQKADLVYREKTIRFDVYLTV